jgi:uncharacterized protein
MSTVFVDTTAWIALANKRDSLHAVARETFDRLWNEETHFLTSEFVLAELGNALSAPEFRTRTARFIETLYLSSTIEIVPSTTELFHRGLTLFGNRPDKGWGLIDCTSFAIMADRALTKAFTQDRHFEQAGFVTLL